MTLANLERPTHALHHHQAPARKAEHRQDSPPPRCPVAEVDAPARAGSQLYPPLFPCPLDRGLSLDQPMTTPNLNTHVARAAAYLAECERKALDSQAELIEAQRRCTEAAPVYRNAGECADLLAAAAAQDAVNGTRTAEILKARLEKQRADAEAQRATHKQAEADAQRAGERHAQAEAYLRAARAGFEVAIQAEAREIADKAAQKYGQALQALLNCHEQYLVAVAVANNNCVSGQDLLPALPTFGQTVASAFASTSATHVYFPGVPVMDDRAAALRAQLVAGQVQ